MQPEKGRNLSRHLLGVEYRTTFRQAGAAFSRWARGGMNVPGNNASSRSRLLQRGLASTTRPQSAQSIVEFLLVSVPLLAIIFGVLEFGLAFYESTNLDWATKEVARVTAACSNSCDKFVQTDPTDPSTRTLVYRDNVALKMLNSPSININQENIDYVLIQHVGEQEDDPNPSNNPYQPGTPDYGRLGPDIYMNYKYHWQLYALPKSYLPASDARRNTVPARSSDPDNLKFNDALPTQIPALNNNGTSLLPMNPDGSNAVYNGWRSNPCLSATDSGGCRQNILPAKVDGTKDDTGTVKKFWPGRYICVPTDRFYVQIVYRHKWITPFMPTINMAGRQTLQGFSDSNALVLSSKSYQKVEPQVYIQSGGACA
ncbi:MAG TPA: TadE/TadG family type IV pilus assembly protein [Chloroflexia bacterium]|nr:TadE/TadG family type IV pilus assembly protein [Chloroflexia bacterium]